MLKILIVSHAMEIGGAEKALLGLLGAFDYSRCQVDLFLLRHQGELMDSIPEEVNLLPENKHYASLAVPLASVIKNGAIGVGVGRFIGNYLAKKYAACHSLRDDGYIYINNSHRYTLPFLPNISDKEYDLAISFLTPHYFVINKSKAKKKIAWIHTDYSSIELDKESELRIWSAYDNIVSISERVTESFLHIFPSLSDKIIEIPNIHPADYIRSLADEFSVTDEMPNGSNVKLLSVGRFCDAKNFDNVPDICSRMENVKWYLIGFGTDEELIRQKIAEAHMDDRVIILGKKLNPYPYFKACDFYVQPSRYEGNAVTVNEALILGKKVAITNYATAPSQIRDGIDGVIVPQDNEGCAKGLMRFINDSDLQARITENVLKTDYSMSDGINKIMNLLEKD